jgi:antitoxin (DNA-binding transcriptional repressor) of toxin-antitoxin stability system
LTRHGAAQSRPLSQDRPGLADGQPDLRQEHDAVIHGLSVGYEVLARVRRGETIDVTEHGLLIARIVPVGERQPTPVLARLVEAGRATLARRPAKSRVPSYGQNLPALILASVTRETW